jgi:hypothetical protein
MPHTSPKPSGTRKRKQRSPVGRLPKSLKNLRENAAKELKEIDEMPTFSPKNSVPFLLKGGKTKKLRAVKRKLRGLPKNVKFMGLMTRKQAHNLLRKH